MRNFAKLNNSNKVIDVTCVHDEIAPTEEDGVDFLTKTTGHSNWKQSFNDGRRKNQAGVGMTYDSSKDAFIPRQIFASWTLNNDTCQWEAPIEKPDDGKRYDWNEKTKKWVELYKPE